MMNYVRNSLIYCKTKTDRLFQRVFKEQAGGAEIVALLIIIAVVLVLALAFRDNLSTLVKSLWNNMTNTGKTGNQPSLPQWN